MTRKALSPEAKSIVLEILGVNSRLLQRYADEFELDHIGAASLKSRLHQQAEVLREVCALLEQGEEVAPDLALSNPAVSEKKSA